MKNRAKGILVLALLTLLILGGAFYIFGDGLFVLLPRRHFDPGLWKNAATFSSVRLRMADDLIGSGKLQGLTRAEIFSLLSEPPKTDYFKEYDLVYYLGPERSSISIDSEWLVVKFGQDGRVAKAAIVRA